MNTEVTTNVIPPHRLDRSAGIAMFDAYTREFDLPDHAILRAFRRLVAEEHMLLEYSIKLEHGELHPARFAIIYDGDMHARIERILDFYAEATAGTDARLDTKLLLLLLRGLDLKSVDLCACGFDLRPRPMDCRFKFWLSIRDQPRKVDEVLGMHGAPDSVLELILGNDLPVGIDLDLRGNSRFKLYPSFLPRDRENRAIRRRLTNTLSPAAVALMDRVERYNVSFDPDLTRVLHLQLLPAQQPAMLAHFGIADHPAIRRAGRLGLRPHVLSVPELQLSARQPEPMNLYFI